METKNTKSVIGRKGATIKPPEGEGWSLQATLPVEGEPDKIEYLFVQDADELGRTLLTQG